MENITELGKLWQEEIMNLSETTPESLDALENRIQDIMQRPGKAMMEWKLLRGYPRDPHVYQLKRYGNKKREKLLWYIVTK